MQSLLILGTVAVASVVLLVVVLTLVCGMHGKIKRKVIVKIFTQISNRLFLAILIFCCLCGCVGCGTRRYYGARRGDHYSPMVSYANNNGSKNGKKM